MSAYSDRVLADGASHYWRLDEAAGLTAVDLVGGANGTISGGVTLNQPGALIESNAAMAFNGTTGRIVTSVATALVTPFTFELWLRRASNTGQQVAFCSTWGAGDDVVIFTPPGQVFVYTGVAGSPTATFPYDTTWHHVACVCAGGVAGKIYIDGTVRPVDDQTPITFVAAVAKSFEMGFDPNWAYFTGSLDEIAVYPRALSAAEIAAHYALGTTLPRSSMPWWQITQIQGGSLMDSFNLWEPITPSNTVDLPRGPSGGILVGGAGDVAAVMQNNVMPVVFAGMPAGSWLPITARRINATGTTATGLVALYEN